MTVHDLDQESLRPAKQYGRHIEIGEAAVGRGDVVVNL